MKKAKHYALLFVILFPLSLWSQDTRKAVWAGRFYDARADMLSNHIDRMLQSAETDAISPSELLALIVPHAGYIYSGPVAAHAYKAVQGKRYENVVCIGTSHRYALKDGSIYLRGGYETPLGITKINEALAHKLALASGFKHIPQAHAQEHSIEVQIPFIQKTLPHAKIVPVLLGIPTEKTITTLAEALAKTVDGGKTLVLVSTDMSHYLPKKDANRVDAETIELLRNFTTPSLIKKLRKRENMMCGGSGVVSALLYAQSRGKAKVQVLKYADSSLAGGGETQVVGYLSAAIIKEKLPRATLSSQEKKELLALARTAVNLFIREHKVLNYTSQQPCFLTKRGAFVTLKKNNRLRGCIGFVDPTTPLYQTIIHAAIYAATKDTRFTPVTSDELKSLEFEISVLTSPKRIDDITEIQVGKHGLIITQGNRTGLLLPQVPVENHWSKDIFLQQACIKAGLPKDAWEKGANVQIFEAIVFQ